MAREHRERQPPESEVYGLSIIACEKPRPERMTAARASVVEVSSREFRRVSWEGDAEGEGPHEVELDLNVLVHFERFGDDRRIRISGANLGESAGDLSGDQAVRQGTGRTLVPPLQPSPPP